MNYFVYLNIDNIMS